MGRAEHEGRDPDDTRELTEHERQAEAIYGERPNAELQRIEAEIANGVPAEIRELRAQRSKEPASALFGGSEFGDELFEATLTDTSVPTETRRAVADEFARMSGDLSMTSNEVAEVASVLNAPIADERTQSRWGRQAEEMLKVQYGDSWEQRLADAKKLLHRDPRVARIVEQRQIGNHPKLVLMLCDLARRERLKGRL
ncbi:MAG: hypothetical protein K2X67_03495 [Burkholderiales bacterium]|nr:hypothetical protein [Burkholderiales bacterium]